MDERKSISILLLTALVLSLLAACAGEAAASGAIGTGPPVDRAFVATAFDVEGQSDALFIAWPSGATGIQWGIESGLLWLDDGDFDAFPAYTLPEGYPNNLGAGSGGPRTDRRAYVVWVGGPSELKLLVYDQQGSIVRPHHTVARAVQVVSTSIAATDAGAFISYAWDGDSYWDPRILAVDLDGSVLQEQVAENSPAPRQTWGVSVSATPEGAYAGVYVVSDTPTARIRRYDASGPVDPAPVEFFGDADAPYVPHSVLFSPADEPPFLFLAVPSATPGYPGLRLARTTFAADDVTLGPELSELVPEFPGGATGVVGLSGGPEYVVVLWQEIEWKLNCGCSSPPPVRVEFLAQIVLAHDPPAAIGAPFTVYLWQQGDPIGPPVTGPLPVASTTPGRFTVLWSDGLLRFKTIDVLGPIVAFLEENEFGTVARWAALPGAVHYNVIRGELANIVETTSTVDLGPVACIEAASTDASTEGREDSATPATGAAFFYLVEAVYGDGSSDSYGTSSAGQPRSPASGGCGASTRARPSSKRGRAERRSI